MHLCLRRQRDYCRIGSMWDQYKQFARLYDLLMRDADYDAWAELIASELPAAPARVADCACGTGEMTLRLKRRGYEVTGIDVSEDMLRVAMVKARRAGLTVPFVREDMRHIALHKKQDAVIAVCDGVNYLASREAMREFFMSAHDALVPGGVLLFDVSSRYKIENTLGSNTFAEDEGDGAYIWKNYYDPDTKLIEMQLTFFERTGENYNRFVERHIQRAHSRLEIEHALTATGFEDIRVYGGLAMEPAEDKSERLYFSARRGV